MSKKILQMLCGMIVGLSFVIAINFINSNYFPSYIAQSLSLFISIGTLYGSSKLITFYI